MVFQYDANVPGAGIWISRPRYQNSIGQVRCQRPGYSCLIGPVIDSGTACETSYRGTMVAVLNRVPLIPPFELKGGELSFSTNNVVNAKSPPPIGIIFQRCP